MITWNPSVYFMKLYRTGTIKIPLGDFFKDFTIDAVRVENNHIVICLFHKDHIFSKLK